MVTPLTGAVRGAGHRDPADRREWREKGTALLM